ncbi:MAG: tetratricopeptide repeat protein [Acidobacteria bacterium]|nr:MAG: tetratricopeptide repeat protein [Acidobacteriota bacterium]REK02886.1 MAG: tetratricopeptide repeat protein [Acidobacteriota bacterium]REK13310.1 MAG: tetratricopeptide repeat protein [Acidobacteriota bacterium]REK41304.1 MAG: tetratricopeptide repeat protein [Acidobacteriota bacterium]
MTKFKSRTFRALAVAMVAAGVCTAAYAQQVPRAPFDVTHYKIDANIQPDLNRLEVVADIDLVPKADTRVITFEMNGSLEITGIERITEGPAAKAPKPKPGELPPPPPGAVTFVQDRVGVSDIGPSVRVDLGSNVTNGTPVKLRFKYGGVLVTPEGGPLLTKRLAFIGPNDGYLMYASRWFPFHDYAADKATSDITIALPESFQVVGHSDVPALPLKGKTRFIRNEPGLVGNFTYGRYVNKKMKFGAFELDFYTKQGVEIIVDQYAETLGKALEYYARRWGTPAMGSKFIVSQIDDESLEYYSQEGMLFLANRLFNESREATLDRLQREAAYQWWGHTVGLKSFDDAWLSQGLAEYSAFSFRESELQGAQLDSLRRELLEKSLTFEQTASLARTPASLDDQSVAYQYIMYAKGAFVFKLLRDTVGEQKFEELLRSFLQKYRGKNASIYDFEEHANQVTGKNLRYFFARWVEGTGVPEFEADYLILRNRAGKFITRGTVKQNYDNLQLPVDLQLRAEGQGRVAEVEVFVEDSSADFNIESDGKPIELIIDPDYKLLRISDDLRISSIARRGIEQFREGNYVEAQQQFEAALKLDRSNAWIYYHLGLLFLEQRNYDLAIDNFKASRNLGRNGQASPTWLWVWSEIKMGNSYDAKGDRTRAVAAYKRAEQIPDDYDNAKQAVAKYLAEPYDPRQVSTTAVR